MASSQYKADRRTSKQCDLQTQLQSAEPGVVRLASALDRDAKQLIETVKDIYGADKYSSKLAETADRDPEAQG